MAGRTSFSCGQKERRRQIARLGGEILTVTREVGIPLIINDHPQIAADIGADGVHVGQDDLPVAEVRKLLGPGRIVGKSTHSLEQARAAFAEKPDYIGFGPLFATPTKPDYIPIGLAQIAQVRQEATLPFFCIGGIKRDNVDTVIAHGAVGVVVVSEILQAPDIRAICAWYREKLLAANPVSH
ncbi:thiamine phosphate synthase [Kamptonema cortianum]|nr:thiamine phosphate synthase [Kamptonema cortianum]